MKQDKHSAEGSRQNGNSFVLPRELKPLIAELSDVKYDTRKMASIVTDIVKSDYLKMVDFPLIPNKYSRTILHREDNGFEIMVARWNKNAVTPIHGHPRFVFVYIIDGVLTETSYVRENEDMVQSNRSRFLPGDYSFEDGIEGRFDNFIHQITADEDSLSLHIYSDDALKGEIFTT